MEVRDAVEADADALAALTDVPASALRNVVHDRTVRVLVDAPTVADAAAPDDSGATGGDEELAGGDAADAVPAPEATDDGTVRGFVSFDVRDGVVHLTQFGGDRAAYDRLLAEPLRFAAAESMPVEVLVGEDDEEMRTALEAEGFELQGRGPAFGGTPTFRYRRPVGDA